MEVCTRLCNDCDRYDILRYRMERVPLANQCDGKRIAWYLQYYLLGNRLPVQIPYFVVNATLLICAFKILGAKFCVKTVYAVIVVTALTSFFSNRLGDIHLLENQPLWAAFLGAVFCGCGIGLGFSVGGSTGGTDIIAAIVNKYRDISLGRVIMICDIFIISSSYLVVHDWEKVLYGYVVLCVQAFCIDQVVNSRRRSVQFFIIHRSMRR